MIRREHNKSILGIISYRALARLGNLATNAAIAMAIAACAPAAANVPPQVPTPVVVAMETHTPTATPELPSLTPTSSATPSPTGTPTRAPTATRRPPTQEPPPAPTVPAKTLLQLTHEYQKLNNCGPVSLGVVTTYFGIPRNQFDVAPHVKGGQKDRNVNPNEMQAYLEKQGLRAITRVNGTHEQIQRLLAAGIPVILHQWLVKPGGELVGHYRVAQGYDEAAGTLTTSDPYAPPRKAYSRAELERWWKPWNHRYIVAYKAGQEVVVRAALGADFDQRENHRRALAHAASAVQQNGQDSALWFNLGDERLAAGDAGGAVEAYDRARALGITPAFSWYNFGPFEALYRVSAYQRILDLSAPMMKDGSVIEEVRYWRGRAYAGLGRMDIARAELTAALQLNPAYSEARTALDALK